MGRMSVAPASVWGACRTCGAAVAPGVVACPLCGAAGPLSAAEVQHAPRAVRRRLRLTRLVRATIVVGVIVALAVALVPPVLTGPPSVADPLTTASSYRLAPGAMVAVVGEITGGDYVLGNYSTIAPYGSDVAVAVYNATAWAALLAHQPATPLWSLPAQSAGRIVFSATVTDDYAFVLTNPYPVSSGVNVTVYLTTTYQSNVANDGFG